MTDFMASQTDVSPCGSALLATIVAAFEANEPVSLNELYTSVPPAHAIAEFSEWPVDANEWVLELATLIDRKLAVRFHYPPRRPTRYVFAPTADGLNLVEAFLDPRRTLNRSAS